MKLVEVIAKKDGDAVEFDLIRNGNTHKIYLRITLPRPIDPIVILIGMEPFNTVKESSSYNYDMYFAAIRLCNDAGTVKYTFSLDAKLRPSIDNLDSMKEFAHQAWSKIRQKVWRDGQIFQEIMNKTVYCDDTSFYEQMSNLPMQDVTPKEGPGTGLTSALLKTMSKLEDNVPEVIERINNYTFSNIS